VCLVPTVPARSSWGWRPDGEGAGDGLEATRSPAEAEAHGVGGSGEGEACARGHPTRPSWPLRWDETVRGVTSRGAVAARTGRPEAGRGPCGRWGYGYFIGRSGRTGEGVTAVPHWAERWVATVRRPTNGESPVHGWRTSRRKPGMRGTRDWGGGRLTYRRSTMELACARPLPSRCRAGFSETDTGAPALHTQQGPAMGDDPPRALSVQDEKRASAGGRKAEGVFKSGCQWPDWRPQDPTLREHYKQV